MIEQNRIIEADKRLIAKLEAELEDILNLPESARQSNWKTIFVELKKAISELDVKIRNEISEYDRYHCKGCHPDETRGESCDDCCHNYEASRNVGNH